MSALERINNWYQEHCDGDWEHGNGVLLESLDNPGWLLQIDVEHPDKKWDKVDDIELEIAEGIFIAFCEPKSLDQMLSMVAEYLEAIK